MTITLPARHEIDPAYTWNSESVFPTVADWHHAAQTLQAGLQEAVAYQGRLHEGPAVLLELMRHYDSVMRLMNKLYFYATMSASVDATDPVAAALNNQAGALYAQTIGTVAFMYPELIEIGQATLHAWIDQTPELEIYRRFVDDLFRTQPHIRSAEVETVLGMADDPFGNIRNIFGVLTSADMTFAPAHDSQGSAYPVGQGTYPTLLNHADRTVRQTAYDSYTDTYLSLKNTLTNIYLTSVKRDVFVARTRRYASAVEASLFSNNIPRAVLDNLLSIFQRNLPTWHRYWEVRRRILGVETLQPYDIWAPLAADQPVVSYEQAVEWISAGMQPLGDDYVAALRRGCLEDRWVDLYPNRGKRAGAFSGGSHDTFPFIMMSFDNTLGGMSTLAHELGHSLHSYYARKHQPAIYSRYTLFVAEVASNFNQALTRAYLRERYADDPQFQIALLEEAMDNFHRYFFIMPTLARFELEVHERAERGQGMTPADLNTLCADLFAEGYGSAMGYDRDREGITWATFGHLYSNFYVYQYATGISAAHELAKDILAGDQSAVQRYLEFLSAGNYLPPLDALRHAGVEMTQPAAVETTFGVLAEMVERLATLAGV